METHYILISPRYIVLFPAAEMNPNSNSGLQRNVLKNMETYATFGISKIKKKILLFSKDAFNCKAIVN